MLLVTDCVVGCAAHNPDVGEWTPEEAEHPAGWHRSATWEFDADTGRWQLVESEHGVGWSSEEFHERLEADWGDLDDE